MIIFPAIDLFEKKAVRLYKGDYSQMTVYSNDPCSLARKMQSEGASHIHLVDLEGAKEGTTPNIDVVADIVKNTDLFVEIGGGIRSMEVLDRYLSVGVDRVILGTAAVNDPEFLRLALSEYGDKIAVGADIKDGRVAVKGWLESSEHTADSFFSEMVSLGVKTIICTDVSRDGAMRGTNLQLYRELGQKYAVNITASGGVSTLDDVKELQEMGVYGAIIGKAYYVGAINLTEAIGISAK